MKLLIIKLLKLYKIPICSFFLVLPLVMTTWAQESTSLSTLSTSEKYLIKDIPSALKDVVIYDQRDIADVLGSLTQSESESFIYDHTENRGKQTVYVFREWINTIHTDNLIYIWVDNDTRLIEEIFGVIRKNIDLPTTPALSEQEATVRVLAYLKRGGERVWDVPTVEKGWHESQLLYRGKELWWGIGIELESSPHEGETHEWFWVSPKGAVQPWVEGKTVQLDVEVCDGSGTPAP